MMTFQSLILLSLLLGALALTKEYSVEHKFTADSDFINRGSLSCSTSEYSCSVNNNEETADALFNIPGEDFYYLRICDKDRECVQTFIKQCLLLESGFRETIEVVISSRKDIVGVSIITPTISCNGSVPSRLPAHLNTRVEVLEPGEAPEPETKVHIKRMEAEKKRKLSGDGEDNRSFISKYAEHGLKEKQVAQLQQCKSSISDIWKPGYHLHTDQQLIKFCIARKWDIKKAESMFRSAMAFRETMRLDHILEEYQPPELLTTYVSGGVGCFDKEGSPVRVERFGFLDSKGMVHSCRRAELEKFKLYEQEQVIKLMKEQSAKTGRLIDKMTIIMDLNKVGSKQLWKPGVELYLHLIKLLEDNYPESVKNFLIVNAPAIFPLIYRAARPLISDDINNKIRVYGAGYQAELLKLIDEEELPAFLGGKQKGPGDDIYCTHRIRAGGIIPQSYYLKDMIDTSELESATVGAGSKLVLRVPIDQPNCVIRWEFMTADKDISFGVDVIPEGSDKPTTVLPVKKVQCHMVPEDGTVVCEKLGTYVLKFDNSYSWTKSKKLRYNIEALIEDDQLADDLNQLMV